MKLRRTSVLVCVLIPVALAYAGLPDVSGSVETALRTGNAATVQRAEREQHAGPGTSRMDTAQLGYDLSHLLKDAQQCEKFYFHVQTKSGLGTALRCNAIARSAALMLGDAHTFVAQSLWARGTLLPALQKAISHAVSFEGGLASANLRELAREVPSPTQSWPSIEVSLAVTRKGSHGVGDARHIVARINDQRVEASIDTLSSVPSVLTIIEPLHGTSILSERLGLKSLINNYGTATLTYLSHQYEAPVDLFLAKNIALGPLVLHDVAVNIIRSDYVPPSVKVGMPMLRHFGSVVIGRKRVTLAKGSMDACPDPVRMTFAANYHLQGSLLFPVSLDGRTSDAVLDISDAGSRVDPRSTMLVAASRRATESPRATVAGSVPVALKVGSQPVRFTAEVSHIPSEPYQVSMGGSILRSYTVHFDFGEAPPTVCFANSDIDRPPAPGAE